MNIERDMSMEMMTDIEKNAQARQEPSAKIKREEEVREWFAQGETLFAAEIYDAAEEYFDRVLSVEPMNQQVYIYKGVAQANLGNFHAARELLEKAVMIDKNHPQAWFHLGNIEFLLGDRNEAIRSLSRAAALGYKDADTFFHLGVMYEDGGEYEQALRSYNKALRINDRQAAYHTRKIALLLTGRRYEEALQAAKELHEALPDAFESYHMLSAVYLAMERFDKADEVLVQALEEYPRDVNLRIDHIRVLMAKGEDKEAFKQLELAGQLTQTQAQQEELMFFRGKLLGLQGDLDGAASCFEAMLTESEEGQEDAQVLYLLMCVRYSQQDFEKLRETAVRAMKSIGNEPLLLCAPYFAALAEEKLAKAQEEGNLTGEDPDQREQIERDEAERNEAEKDEAERNEAEKDEAEKNREERNETERDETESRNAEGIRLEKKRAQSPYRKAIRYYRQISIGHPERIEAYLFRAMCHKDLQEYQQALELIDYIQKLYPTNGDIYLMKALILQELGDGHEAAEAFERAREFGSRLAKQGIGGETAGLQSLFGGESDGAQVIPGRETDGVQVIFDGEPGGVQAIAGEGAADAYAVSDGETAGVHTKPGVSAACVYTTPDCQE